MSIEAVIMLGTSHTWTRCSDASNFMASIRVVQGARRAGAEIERDEDAFELEGHVRVLC